MATITNDQRSRILKLKLHGKSHRAIARECGVSVSTVHKVSANALTQPTEQDSYERFQELTDFYRKWVGWDGKAPDPPKHKPGRTVKIAVANDLHVPAHDQDAFAEFLRANKDADECFIPGDLLDLFSFSRYPKYKRPFTPRDEFQQGQAVINTLSEAFPKVRLMSGNHDARMLKYLVRQGCTPEIIEYFEMMAPGFSNPLARMCVGLKNVAVVEPVQHHFASYPHIHQRGDIIFSHAEKFSKVPNKAVADVILWLSGKMLPMGLVKPFRVVAQAHTHMAGKTFNDFSVVGMELGCMAKVPDYDGDAQLRGANRPPAVGYSVFYQTDGVTDVNRSNFIALRW